MNNKQADIQSGKVLRKKKSIGPW